MPKKAPKKSLKDFSLGILLATAVGILIFILEFALAWLLYLLIGRDNLLTPLWNAIYQALIYVLTLVLLLSAPRLLNKLKIAKKAQKMRNTAKTSREELGLRGLPTWTDIGLAPVGLIVYFLAAAGLTAIFKLFPWFDALETQDVGFSNLYFAADRIIAFIALVVIAPIAEETIFRGFLYGKLRNRLSIFPAMLIVSLLFAILHGQWNVGVNVFALSLVLCSLREITGTIYSGVIVHMLKNALAFYLLYIVGM